MPEKVRLLDIVDQIDAHHPGVDTWMINRAYVYSAKVHQGQLRKSGEPYLTHPMAVALLLASRGMDVETVAAGLLHDTIEDTWATAADLEETFGAGVRKLVEGVTKLSQFAPSSKDERQIRSFRKLILASIDDPRVLVIKLADRTHNMRTISAMRSDKQKKIADETLHIYAPIAHRLGMQMVQDELEDCSFAILHPETYRELEEKKRRLIANKADYTERIITALEEVLASNDLAATVSGRTKHLYSIWGKMQRDDSKFEELYDIIAFRIVVDDVASCYAALGVVHALWQPLSGRIKDYIAVPKSNGYRSLHTTVIGEEETLIEIQIRTREMHRYAEEGIAAHWRYKDGSGETQTQAEFYRILRQVLESTDQTDKAGQFFEIVKDGLQQGQIFVFTPKGDVIELPQGSKVIDFAYRIHTEVGHRCTGAMVNGRWVPIRQELNHGDIISVQTQAGHVPKRDWLAIAHTSSAKAKIRTYLKDLESDEAIRQGRDILERQVRNQREDKRKLTDDQEQQLAKALGLGSVERLYRNLGSGRLAPQMLREKLASLLGQDDDHGLRLPVPEGLSRWVRKAAKEKPDVTIEGESGLMLRLAKCCKPIQGDEVVGFITRGRGVTVHRAGCKTVEGADPSRILTANWGGDGGHQMHTVRLRVLMKDEPGVLAKISQVIARQGVNIAQTHLTTTADGGEGIFVVLVRNREQLDRLIATLRKTRGIQETERIS